MDLLEIRDKIDSVDKEIVNLYEKRMDLCGSVADYKIATGKKVLDKEREAQKLEKVTELATNPDNKKGVNELFSQIMAISRKMQYKKLAENGIAEPTGFVAVDELKENPKVVYQGEPGAYAYEATMKYFGDGVDCYNVPSWRTAMEDIKAGKADYGVFPIENSTAGIVNDVYDLLVEYDNYIVGETFLNIRHALLGVPGATIDTIETIYSHPQALMQCEPYLRDKNWKQMSYSNTASSALKVSKDKDKTVAAIASTTAAKLYGLEVLQEAINPNEKNTTRFIVVGNKKEYIKGADKISICFEIAHESGSLYNMLSHLIYNGLNMTKIESRPIPERTWEYRFFVDVDGRLEAASVDNAFTGMKAEANEFKILGNYR